MFDSNAITRMHSVILAAIIIVAAVTGGVAYVFLSNPGTSETIKIGVLADLDGTNGRHIWQAAVLACEQINAEGGILGRRVEVLGEDHNIEEKIDSVEINSALTRLITFHNVDFIIGQTGVGEVGFMCQDTAAEHKIILIALAGNDDLLCQRVIDDYDRYKYYFRVTLNATSTFQGMVDSLLLCRELTGFNKIGYLGQDWGWTKGIMPGLDSSLSENGFDLVHKGAFSRGTFDFSSYFAAAESAGVEVLVPLIAGDEAIPFAKEYYDRQSPMLVYGGALGDITSFGAWEWTDGKCNNIATAGNPIVVEYPISSKTQPVQEAYANRWGERLENVGSKAYDALRFILADAIKRAGTIETDAVIEALEETSIETTNAKNFVFTSSHDVMMGENPNDPDADYWIVMLFQWQDGELVPVYPKKIMDEAGVTLTFPDWLGPWSK